jgi:hypothetical protein
MAAGATYEPIATATVTTGTDITFSSIPSTYTDLILVSIGTFTGDGQSIVLRFNGDTGNNYSFTGVYGTGSTASSARQSNQPYIPSGWWAYIGSAQNSNSIVHIMNYANTTTYKTALSRFNNATGGTGSGTEALVGTWRSTSAINSIRIFSTGSGQPLASGFTATLYGVTAA